MSKRKAKLVDPGQGANGRRFHVYVSSKTDLELIDFINRQSDISGAVMLGFLELYNKYGNVDLADYLPRTFKVNSNLSIPTVTEDIRNLTNQMPPQINKEITISDSPDPPTPLVFEETRQVPQYFEDNGKDRDEVKDEVKDEEEELHLSYEEKPAIPKIVENDIEEKTKDTTEQKTGFSNIPGMNIFQ